MNKIINFYIYRILSRMYFHLPVLFVFFYSEKIEIFKIELLLAAYAVTISIFGKVRLYIMKYFKYKYIISVGEVLKACGLLIIIIKPSFNMFLIGQIITGIGFSFATGTESMLLKKIYPNSLNSEYSKIESSSISYMFISTLFAGIIGSIIFTFNSSGVFILSAITSVLAAIFILFLAETPQPSLLNKNKKNKQTKDLIELNNYNISFWIYNYALTRAFNLSLFIGFLPYYYFIELQINIYFFGLILGFFNIFAFISARYITRWSEKSNSNLIVIMPIALSFLSMLIFSISEDIYISLIAISLMGLSSGGVRPLTISKLNSQSSMHPNVFAEMEKKFSYWNTTLLILGGLIISIWSFSLLMIIFSFLYLSLLILLFLKRNEL